MGQKNQLRTSKRRPERAETRRNGLSGASSFGALADGLGIGLAVVCSEGEIRYCNTTFTGVLDFSPASIGSDCVGLNILDRLVPHSRAEFGEALRHARYVSVDGKLEVLSREDQLRTFRVSLSPFGKPGIHPDIWILAHEVTELLEAGRALSDSKGSVSFLSARLMQTQDAERRRMARDLHDITGQELAVILMALTRLSNNIGSQGFDAKADLAETTALVRKVENEIRTLSYVLHPPMLDELGLKSALGWYLEGFTKRSKIRVEMDIQEALPRLSRDKEIAIFRVVQESLTNVLRHAHSATARIGAEVKRGQLALVVQDAGQGFSTDLLNPGKSQRVVPGVGIYGMRERLQQLGGDLSVESTPRGTVVRASVPLGSEPQEAVPEEQADQEAASSAEPLSTNGSGHRILIVDDHELLRVGIRSLLDNEPGCDVCGEAVDGMDAVSKVRALKPELVIMDLIMPRLGGFVAAQRIKEFRPSTKILVFTNYSYGQIQSTIRSIGCDAYVSKARASTDLILAIRAVLRGEKFFDSSAQPKSA